jgi:hypothetical protein
MKHFQVLIAGLVIWIASSSIIFAQTESRTINFVKARNEPLEITKLKASGKEVKFNQPFTGGGTDWFRDLSVTVKNVSNQTISSIDIRLVFYSSEAGGIPLLDHLWYGCNPLSSNKSNTSKCREQPLQPNESVTLFLKDYESTRTYLTKTGKPQNINQFDLMIGYVIFADKIMWDGGETFKQDPNNSNRWLPEKKANSKQ